MAVGILEPRAVEGEQRMVLDGISYDAYRAIDDALGERHSARLIYADGRLTFSTSSRLHEWYAERLAELAKAVARALRIKWEDAGSATYRLMAKEAGVEPDKTFYLGANAARMRGAVNIDLGTQPPPDLVIEVEFSHPADEAMVVYGRLGVPEVWRVDVASWTMAFCLRNADGTFSNAPAGRGFPVLTAQDILDQLRLADTLGASDWSDQIDDWARATLTPRLGGEA